MRHVKIRMRTDKTVKYFVFSEKAIIGENERNINLDFHKKIICSFFFFLIINENSSMQ